MSVRGALASHLPTRPWPLCGSSASQQPSEGGLVLVAVHMGHICTSRLRVAALDVLGVCTSAWRGASLAYTGLRLGSRQGI